jgi:hypothetical protein
MIFGHILNKKYCQYGPFDFGAASSGGIPIA